MNTITSLPAILLVIVMLQGCGNEVETSNEPALFEQQTEALEKAKKIESMLLDAEQKRAQQVE